MRILPKTSGPLSAIFAALVVAAIGISISVSIWIPFPIPIREILSNLAAYLALINILIALMVIVVRRSLGKLFSFLLVAHLVALSVNLLIPIARFYLPAVAVSQAGRTPVTLLSVDLERSLPYAQEIVTYITRERPGIVGLSGVTPEMAPLFAAFEGYPTSVLRPREDSFGFALFSKFQMQGEVRTEVSEPYEELPPILRVDLLIRPGRQVPVYLLRLPPPFNKSEEVAAEILIRRVFVPLRHFVGEYIALGNLNATPTSGYYARLWWATKIHNAMQGSGYLPSCCADSNWLRIPINHILYKGDFGVDGFQVLPHSHGRIAPVFAELWIPGG